MPVQIRAFVIYTSLGFPNKNMKGKTKKILVLVVKWRHRANGLFLSVVLFSESDYPTIYKLFPRADIKFIPDSRHWLIIEKPKEFAQTVMEFLAKDTADHQF